MRSYKGIGGGYELAMAPHEINLLMIVRCIEGDEPFNACIIEDHECSTRGLCPLHQPWSGVRDQLLAFLEQNTLANLAGLRQSQLRESQGGVL